MEWRIHLPCTPPNIKLGRKEDEPVSIYKDIPAKKWTKVVSGWGKYSVDYGISVSSGQGKYKCYVAGVPFPASSGNLPSPVVTLNVIGYGEIKVYSTEKCTCVLVPVGP